MNQLIPDDVIHFLTCQDETDTRFLRLAQIVNVAICEWRGWERCISAFQSKTDPELRGWRNKNRETRKLPNHILGKEALGNCHEAENELTEEQYYAYTSELRSKATVPGTRICNQYDKFTISANSRQRGITILRVVKPEMFL